VAQWSASERCGESLELTPRDFQKVSCSLSASGLRPEKYGEPGDVRLKVPGEEEDDDDEQDQSDDSAADIHRCSPFAYD
jgi:hypothetical protein